MKKKIGVSQTSGEILRELVDELAIPLGEEVELLFDAGNGDGITALQGPECVFCILMEQVKNSGYRLVIKTQTLNIYQTDKEIVISYLKYHSNASSFTAGCRRYSSRRSTRCRSYNADWF